MALSNLLLPFLHCPHLPCSLLCLVLETLREQRRIRRSAFWRGNKHPFGGDSMGLSFQWHRALYPLPAPLPHAELTPCSSPLTFLANMKEQCPLASVHKHHLPSSFPPFPQQWTTVLCHCCFTGTSDLKSTVRSRTIKDVRVLSRSLE